MVSASRIMRLEIKRAIKCGLCNVRNAAEVCDRMWLDPYGFGFIFFIGIL